ncbi:hypothetical protein FRC14_007431 [Serendipita sp. 396]|nr:hypothetical protein FRC14_007431 [Serendipita sp. 396]
MNDDVVVVDTGTYIQSHPLDSRYLLRRFISQRGTSTCARLRYRFTILRHRPNRNVLKELSNPNTDWKPFVVAPIATFKKRIIFFLSNFYLLDYRGQLVR